MSHAVQGLPRRMGHRREFWQNVIHWWREWQTIPVKSTGWGCFGYDIFPIPSAAPILQAPLAHPSSVFLSLKYLRTRMFSVHTAPILRALNLPSFMAVNRSPWPGDNAHVSTYYAAVCLPVCMYTCGCTYTCIWMCYHACLYVCTYTWIWMSVWEVSSSEYVCLVSVWVCMG